MRACFGDRKQQYHQLVTENDVFASHLQSFVDAEHTAEGEETRQAASGLLASGQKHRDGHGDLLRHGWRPVWRRPSPPPTDDLPRRGVPAAGPKLLEPTESIPRCLDGLLVIEEIQAKLRGRPVLLFFIQGVPLDIVLRAPCLKAGHCCAVPGNRGGGQQVQQELADPAAARHGERAPADMEDRGLSSRDR